MCVEHIIGGKTDKPRGSLDILADPGYDTMAISAAVPSWAKRSKRYLDYKQAKLRHRDWWRSSGKLSEAMTADNWVSAFGPIAVEFRRTRGADASAGKVRQFGAGPARVGARFEGTNPGHVKISIGTVRIHALTNITPGMLPGLRSGNPQTPIPTTGNDELMLMVQAGMGDDIAYRLGRLSSAESGGQYRPTLEPFLTFFLTRSVPAAVAKRLEIGGFSTYRGAGRGRVG
jgi:hypothetical protein